MRLAQATELGRTRAILEVSSASQQSSGRLLPRGKSSHSEQAQLPKHGFPLGKSGYTDFPQQKCPFPHIAAPVQGVQSLDGDYVLPEDSK